MIDYTSRRWHGQALFCAVVRPGEFSGGAPCVHNSWRRAGAGRQNHPGGNVANGLEDFQKFRLDLNEEILGCGHLGRKRFFALDHQGYERGPLGSKTKELLGLVASAVLRCDDCITYHLVRCGEEGSKRDEVIDALNVALIVGGSITIPHLRRAFARMREIQGLNP
jgi:AhpD family alkylhydroperoxidase